MVARRSRARLSELVNARGTAGRHRAFRALFTDDEVVALTGHRPPRSLRWDLPPDDDARRQLARLDAVTYLRPTLLRDADVYSMWHGIELRVPFVDTRVFRSVLEAEHTPTKMELAQAWGDNFLVAKAVEPKLTFRLPWERWLDAITSSSHHVLGGPDPWRGLVDRNLANSMIARSSSEPLRPWALVVLARWLDLRDSARLSPTADIALQDRVGEFVRPSRSGISS